MKKRLWLNLITFIFLCQGIFAQTTLEKEEYLVYATFVRSDSKFKPVILDRTDKMRIKVDDKYFGKTLSQLKRETIQNFNEKNLTSASILPEIPIKNPYLLISEKEIDAIFQKHQIGENWKKFYEQFPNSGGYFEFTRVGFDRQKTQALLFVSHYCGGLCASGTYYFLSKQKNGWKVRKTLMMWVS